MSLTAKLQAALAPGGCPVAADNVTRQLHATDASRHQRLGVSWRERLIGSVDLAGRLGTLAPELCNDLLEQPAVRAILARVFGLSARRPLPRFAHERFDHWFQRREGNAGRERDAKRGRLILWDDTFTRYHEPGIGRAAVRVLEAAGFEVTLPTGRRCCGRPAFSQGLLEEAAALGRHNLALLATAGPAPILFLEPSCLSMFLEDYAELGLPGADEIRGRCVLWEEFMAALLSREPEALEFRPRTEAVVIHAHCHIRALQSPGFLPELVRRLPGRTATLLDSGCCGMAGAFGAMKENETLSRQVAEPLLRQLESLPAGTRTLAHGTSCRQQIAHLLGRAPMHPAELVAEALAGADRAAGSGDPR